MLDPIGVIVALVIGGYITYKSGGGTDKEKK